MAEVNTNVPFELRCRSLPELSCSTSPDPLRPVRLPPTVYPPPMWQAVTASAAAAVKRAASQETRISYCSIRNLPLVDQHSAVRLYASLARFNSTPGVHSRGKRAPPVQSDRREHEAVPRR